VPLYLGIDTATPYLSVALWSPELGVVSTLTDKVDRDHARQIMGVLRSLFGDHHLSPADVGGIGVGTGPGSYTGVRVGIATAKGLARGWDVPLVGASTLAAIAFGQLAAGESAIITLDARRNHVYAGAFQRTHTDVKVMTEHGKYPLAELQTVFGVLPVIQDSPPDAVYLAQRAADGGPPAEAQYF
jgi:tRNA threonylcarbamoyladenosine biosynthesis protein TsaB